MSADQIREIAKNNEAYVTKHQAPWAMNSPMDFKVAIVVSCMDPRCNPNEFWNLDSKGPAVLRNAGGRASEALSSIRTLCAIAAGAGEGVGAVAVIHHTDCGTLNFGKDWMKRESKKITREGHKHEVDKIDFPNYTDLEDSVRKEMAVIKTDPFLPADLEVLGFVYDISTGKTTEVGETGFTDAGTTLDLSVTRA